MQSCAFSLNRAFARQLLTVCQMRHTACKPQKGITEVDTLEWKGESVLCCIKMVPIFKCDFGWLAIDHFMSEYFYATLKTLM